MSKHLVITLRAIGTSISFCSLIGALLTSDLRLTTIFASIGITMVLVTLGEH